MFPIYGLLIVTNVVLSCPTILCAVETYTCRIVVCVIRATVVLLSPYCTTCPVRGFVTVVLLSPYCTTCPVRGFVTVVNVVLQYMTKSWINHTSLYITVNIIRSIYESIVII